MSVVYARVVTSKTWNERLHAVTLLVLATDFHAYPYRSDVQCPVWRLCRVGFRRQNGSSDLESVTRVPRSDLRNRKITTAAVSPYVY